MSNNVDARLAADARLAGAVSSGRVLVTGGTRGIGLAVVAALAARGAQVVAVGRDEAALARLETRFANVRPLRANLLERGETRAVVARALALLGGLDGVVQAAGVVQYGPLVECDDAAVDTQWEVDFRAPLRIAQDAALAMIAQGTGGAIVHIASTLGLRPAAGIGVYSAAKAALISITRTLALELGSHHIRVNAVAPGVVDTEMVRVARAPGADPTAQLRDLAAMHPMGRVGQPSEVAEAVVHLLDASWTTGSTLVVDGGLLAG